MHRGVRALAWLAVGGIAVWGTLYLFAPEVLLPFPNWFWPAKLPWWWPFRPQRFGWRPAPLAAALIGEGLLVGIAAFPHALGLRATTGIVLAGGFLLHAAILALPERGLVTYARRLASSGHAEFVLRAALHPAFVDTLAGYEEHLRDGFPATFSREKGPANLAFHVAVHRAAELPLIRDCLRRAVDDEAALSADILTLLRQRFRVLPEAVPALATEIERTLLFMPIVSAATASLLPLPGLLLGMALFRERDAAVLLGAMTAALPAILVEKVQLDGSVFPLLFLTGLALFVSGWQERRPGVIAVSGLVAATYLYFTLSGLVLVALCAAFAVPDLGSAPRRAAWGRAAVYGVVVLGVLLLLRAVLSFHVVDRYLDARGLQAGWRGGPPENWRWVVLNSLEFFLTLGPVLAALSVFGTLIALGSLAYPTAAERFALAVAATFLAVAVVGRNSEVYRLWAFWGPAFLGAVVLATRALGGSRRRAAGVVVLAAHLLWLLPFATHFGHLP